MDPFPEPPGMSADDREPNRLGMFGLVLSAVGTAMDEDHLANEEAVALLRTMLLPGPQPPEVWETIARLEAIDEDDEDLEDVFSELDLRLELGQEGLRFLDMARDGSAGPLMTEAEWRAARAEAQDPDQMRLF